MDDPGQPQYTSNLSWYTTAKPDGTTFTFPPTEGHYPITIVALDETQAAE